MKILFVCNQGKNRSTTAAEIFKDRYKTDFGGIYNNFFEEANLEWADMIIVMEEHQRAEIGKKYPKQYMKKKILCLDIPDIYDYMQKELIDLIELKMKKLGF